MSEFMKWGVGNPDGVGIGEQNQMAEAPAAGDLFPCYDVSGLVGKSVPISWMNRQRELTKEGDGSLSAAEMSDTIISNYGQADADVALNLPTAGPGMRARFTVYTARAKKWGVRAGASDKIYLISPADGTVSAGADQGYARFTNAVLGQCMDVWSFKTGAATWDWMAKAISVATSALAAA